MAWENAPRTTCQKFSLQFDKLNCENQMLCLPSQYLKFVLGIANMPYLLTDNELGDGEGID